MTSLKINKINEILYTLKDADDMVYELVIKFIDVDLALTVGDMIQMNEELLDFGDVDVIKVKSANKEVLLKRLYA